MTNVTLSGYCSVTLDHHTAIVNEMTNLDIKSFAKLMVTTSEAATTTLVGSQLDIRSGAQVSSLRRDYIMCLSRV